MSRCAPRLRSVIIVLFGTYLFVYPWSIILVALDRVPVWGTWMGGALLILQGSIMGLWLIANYGRYGTTGASLILLLSWLIEHIGVTTGFPFGTYMYTDELMPKLMGVVPLAIPFAWLMVVPSSVGIIERLVNRGGATENLCETTTFFDVPISRVLLKVLGAASFAVILDITMEPLAVHINRYWVWHNVNSGYNSVPATNFAAWWVTSLLLVAILLLLQKAACATRLPPILPMMQAAAQVVQGSRFTLHPSRFKRVLPWLPPLLYLLNITMFSLVNIAHVQKTEAVIGATILCYLVYDWLKPYLVRRLVGADSGQQRET